MNMHNYYPSPVMFYAYEIQAKNMMELDIVLLFRHLITDADSTRKIVKSLKAFSIYDNAPGIMPIPLSLTYRIDGDKNTYVRVGLYQAVLFDTEEYQIPEDPTEETITLLSIHAYELTSKSVPIDPNTSTKRLRQTIGKLKSQMPAFNVKRAIRDCQMLEASLVVTGHNLA